MLRLIISNNNQSLYFNFWQQNRKIWSVPQKISFLWKKNSSVFSHIGLKKIEKQLNLKTRYTPALFFRYCSFWSPLISIDSISPKKRTVNFFSRKPKNGSIHSLCQKYRYLSKMKSINCLNYSERSSLPMDNISVSLYFQFFIEINEFFSRKNTHELISTPNSYTMISRYSKD